MLGTWTRAVAGWKAQTKRPKKRDRGGAALMKRQIGKRFLEISFYFPFLLQKRHTNFFLSLSSPGNGHSCSPAAKSCVISKDHEKNFSEGICQLLFQVVSTIFQLEMAKFVQTFLVGRQLPTTTFESLSRIVLTNLLHLLRHNKTLQLMRLKWSQIILIAFVVVWCNSVWPNLAEFCHFGKSLLVFGKFWWFIYHLAKCWAYFSNFVILLG